MISQVGVVLLELLVLANLQQASDKKERGYLMPSEDLLVVIANQPEAPIEFLRAFCVGFPEGGGWEAYQIRNRSGKAISRYDIATINSEGSYAERSTELSDPAHYFFPGQIRPRELNYDEVPLTAKLRAEHHLDGKMKRIIVFMIVKVEFADGSKFDATRQYESLKVFFERNARAKEDQH